MMQGEVLDRAAIKMPARKLQAYTYRGLRSGDVDNFRHDI